MSHLTVSQLELHSLHLHTAMSDSKSINTLLLDVMISSKIEQVFVCDLTELTLQIIFDAWWASMNVGLKHPIAWSNSNHAPSWCIYLYCGM
jgi:hypothetical protein